VTFHVERWREFYVDAQPLMRRHWQEIALDQENVPLALDLDRYQAMDDSGILHILAARVDGQLAGYFLAFVLPHVHYATAGLMAFTDIYFLAPEARLGANGIELFIEAEKSLAARGVVKAYISTKVHKDIGNIFEALGWTLTDRAFAKRLAV
jgi:hypothetical protein